MDENQFNELAALIRGLNGCLIEVAQEAADLRADLQTIATHLATLAAVMGGQP